MSMSMGAGQLTESPKSSRGPGEINTALACIEDEVKNVYNELDVLVNRLNSILTPAPNVVSLKDSEMAVSTEASERSPLAEIIWRQVNLLRVARDRIAVVTQGLEL